MHEVRLLKKKKNPKSLSINWVRSPWCVSRLYMVLKAPLNQISALCNLSVVCNFSPVTFFPEPLSHTNFKKN